MSRQFKTWPNKRLAPPFRVCVSPIWGILDSLCLFKRYADESGSAFFTLLRWNLNMSVYGYILTWAFTFISFVVSCIILTTANTARWTESVVLFLFPWCSVPVPASCTSSEQPSPVSHKRLSAVQQESRWTGDDAPWLLCGLRTYVLSLKNIHCKDIGWLNFLYGAVDFVNASVVLVIVISCVEGSNKTRVWRKWWLSRSCIIRRQRFPSK